ncbi:MAG: CBO0543 family protein [Syntrophomonas sp.]
MANAFWGIVPSDKLLSDMELQLTHARIENWLHHDLFTWQWWLLVSVLIVPWFIWWHYVDRKRVVEIALFGAIILIISSFLDSVLSEFVMWSYDYEIIPVWPRLISADFSVMPITYMFIYQYSKEWKDFLLIMIFVAAAFAFIGEPILMWLKIYKLHQWKHIYSFSIYIALGIFTRYLILTLRGKQNQAKSRA